MAGAIVTAAAVISGTIVLAAAIVTVFMAVVVAGSGSSCAQRARQQSLHRRVRASLHARVNGYALLRKRHARALAHAAANQRVHAQTFELAGQRAMPGAVSLDDARSANRAVFHIVEFKLPRVPEMLKDISIIIGNRDAHD